MASPTTIKICRRCHRASEFWGKLCQCAVILCQHYSSPPWISRGTYLISHPNATRGTAVESAEPQEYPSQGIALFIYSRRT